MQTITRFMFAPVRNLIPSWRPATALHLHY